MKLSDLAALLVAADLVLGACASDSGGPTPPGGGPDGSVRPAASAGHELVFHDALGVVLLVNAGLGGATSPPATQPSQLWAWNGAGWRLVDSAGPPIRNLGGVAYDPAREVLVVHGGTYSAQLSYGDTWEWRADAGWNRVDVPGPGVRDHTQMTYDAARRQVVLFGGQRDTSTFPSDTWLWDGGQWSAVSGSTPGGRVHHAMQYDPDAGVVVVFGGVESGTSDRGDTWGWNGASWAKVLPDQASRTHARHGVRRVPPRAGAGGWVESRRCGPGPPGRRLGAARRARRSVRAVFCRGSLTIEPEASWSSSAEGMPPPTPCSPTPGSSTRRPGGGATVPERSRAHPECVGWALFVPSGMPPGTQCPGGQTSGCSG